MTLAESREPTSPTGGKPEFTAAEIGALAHLSCAPDIEVPASTSLEQ
jgi:hypothetical protein